MLALDKGNFHALFKNRTRDPPVQWLERPINMQYSEGREFNSRRGTKIFTGSVCVLLTSVSLKLIKIRIKIFFTAAWLAQLGERRSAEREVAGSNPGRTNTQGL